MSVVANSVARSDVGHVRANNEDAYLSRPDLGLWIVADGMGGHDRGDRASQLVVGRLGEVESPSSPQQFAKNVDEVLAACHHELLEESVHGQITGTTVVALLSFAAHFAVLWAGDSRCYRYRTDGTFAQLSKDHSVVQDLVDRGLITKEAARHHPLGNRVTRAIGASRKLELDAEQGQIRDGDTFLLCSDGLTGMVDDATIETALSDNDHLAAADRLIALALEAGGTDNVTLIIVRFIETLDDERTVPSIRNRP